jgi:hypothetical protein
MAGVRDWRVELIEAYPDLFHPAADHPGVAQAYPEHGEGWRDLLERACGRIRVAVQAEGGRFKLTQVIEKFATIRIYWDGTLSIDAASRVEEVIALAEARSGCTCEVCGPPGRLYDRGGWLATACPDHASGGPVPIRPLRENLHIVRGVIEDRVSVSCRRYDRDSDAFVHVDPRSVDIEEE